MCVLREQGGYGYYWRASHCSLYEQGAYEGMQRN